MVVFTGVPVMGMDDTAKVTITPDKTDPGIMAADLLAARPVGMAAFVAGTAIFAISLPFSILGGNTDVAFDRLVIDPARYTFFRPLGDFEQYPGLLKPADWRDEEPVFLPY